MHFPAFRKNGWLANQLPPLPEVKIAIPGRLAGPTYCEEHVAAAVLDRIGRRRRARMACRQMPGSNSEESLGPAAVDARSPSIRPRALAGCSTRKPSAAGNDAPHPIFIRVDEKVVRRTKQERREPASHAQLPS